MSFLRILWEAIKEVFNKPKYIIGFIVVSFVLFGLLIYIPVITIPGNDVGYQLSIMPKQDFVVLTTLSFLTGLTLMFHWYILTNQSKGKALQVGHMTFSGLMGFVSSFFGTLTCISCAATVLGFFGLGTVLFFGKYRFYIASIAFILMAVSLYLTSLKVLNLCEECNNLQIKRR